MIAPMTIEALGEVAIALGFRLEWVSSTPIGIDESHSAMLMQYAIMEDELVFAGTARECSAFLLGWRERMRRSEVHVTHRESLPIVEVAKADPVGSSAAMPMCIIARREVGSRVRFEDVDFEKKAREFYADEARVLVETMLGSLPGGTIDALIVRLLDHRRSALAISHDVMRED